ncbi:MAG TPA: hypothetical protein VHJ19_11685, partial [Gammaproteobacteria bacterium]|nr:hypothetical protein [Gammaproteobacteria bacterium]
YLPYRMSEEERIVAGYVIGSSGCSLGALLVLQRYLLLQPHRGKPLRRMPSAASFLRVVRV